MTLIYNPERREFVLQCAYSERDFPRQAGFMWDIMQKRWVTKTLRVAVKLRGYADRDANNEIDRVLIRHTPWLHRIDSSPRMHPKPFQIDAARFALERNHSYLALDPGLGKTGIAAMISRATQGEMRWLYFCPPFLVETVLYEFEKWGARPPIVFPDSKISRKAVTACVQEFASEKNTGIFVDEAHRYKEQKAARTRAMFQEIVPHVSKTVMLSGTPMPNRAMELFEVLNACAPETIDFASRFEYGVKYCAGFKDEHGWNFQGSSNMEELGRKVKGSYMLRLHKKDVLTELPPKVEELVLLGDKLPRQIADIDRKILRNFSTEDLLGGAYEHLATYRRELGKLKAPKTAEYVREILEDSDESILLFAIHKETVALLAVNLANYNPIIITGDTPVSSRNGLVNSFQSDRSRRIVIGNIDACGVGFTMTKATRVIFAEFAWTPGTNDQASDRAHRIGQTDSVLVQYMVFKDSVDRTVIETILRKKEAIKHV